jgi:hypothetical protein
MDAEFFMSMPYENDPIHKFQADMQLIISQAEHLRPILRSCQDAIERSEMKASIVVAQRNSMRPTIEIMAFCKRLDESIPLFRELAKEGLHTDKNATHKDHNLFDVMAMRDYSLGPDVSVKILLSTSSKDEDGPSCRMEQVGVKEVPVYEMRCD